MSKYGIFSGPYFPKFGKIQTRKNSVFGHFSRSVLKKQPPEVFFKKAVLKIFRNTYRKVPMLDSLVNKVTGLEDCNLN